MDQMKRFAVYFTPRPGDFATRAAAWLGWDAEAGKAVAQPDVPGIAQITEEPRKYGFHATLRAPFRLAPGVDLAAVQATVADLATRLAPAQCEGLQLASLEGFLALIPRGNAIGITDLAAQVVAETNGMRAALTQAEVARRRPESLTVLQMELLNVYGYPYVFEEFQFHLTLTGRLPVAQSETVAALLARYFGPVLPTPFVIQDLCLFGEDVTGRFHLLNRYALTG